MNQVKMVIGKVERSGDIHHQKASIVQVQHLSLVACILNGGTAEVNAGNGDIRIGVGDIKLPAARTTGQAAYGLSFVKADLFQQEAAHAACQQVMLVHQPTDLVCVLLLDN